MVARFGTFWERGRGLMMRGKGGGGKGWHKRRTLDFRSPEVGICGILPLAERLSPKFQVS